MRFSSTALLATLVCLLSSYASAHTIYRPASNALIQSNIKYRNVEAVVEGTGDPKPEPSSRVDDDGDEAASVEEDCDEDNEDQDDDCEDIAVQDDCDDDENNDDDETDDCDEDDTTPAPMPSATTASAHAGPKTAQSTKTATPAATSTGLSQQNLAQAPQPSSSVASESQHADCETIKTVYITVTETALNTAMLAAKPTGISVTDTTFSPATPQPSPTPAAPSTEDDGADDDEIPFCDEDADTTAIASPAAQGPTTAFSAASPAKTTAGAAATGQEAAVEDIEPECDDEADEEASQDDEECDEDSSSDQAEVDDCEEDGEPTPATVNSNLFANPQQEDGPNTDSTTSADFKSHDNTALQSASVTSVSASRPSPAKASNTAADAMLAEQDPVDGRDGMTTVTGAVPAVVTAADASRRRRARHWVG